MQGTGLAGQHPGGGGTSVTPRPGILSQEAGSVLGLKAGARMRLLPWVSGGKPYPTCYLVGYISSGRWCSDVSAGSPTAALLRVSFNNTVVSVNAKLLFPDLKIPSEARFITQVGSNRVLAKAWPPSPFRV